MSIFARLRILENSRFVVWMNLFLICLGCNSQTPDKKAPLVSSAIGTASTDEKVQTAQESQQDDALLLQGAWRLEKHLISDQKAGPEESQAGNGLLISQDQMSFFDPHGRPRNYTPQAKFELNQSTDPRSLVTIPPEPTPRDVKNGLTHFGIEAIYHVKGDVLKVCTNGIIEGLPKSFVGHKNSPFPVTLLEYKRIPEADLHPHPKVTANSRADAILILKQFGAELSTDTDGEQDELVYRVELLPTFGGDESKAKAFYDAHMKIFEFLPELEVLDLRGASITDQGLSSLIKLEKLRELSLRDTIVKCEGIAVLGQLASLEKLEWKDCPLTTTGLVEVGKLTQLKELDLSWTEVLDDWLKSLSTLENLEFLDLQETAVTGAGMSALVSLPNLKRVILPFDAPNKEKARELLPNVQF